MANAVRKYGEAEPRVTQYSSYEEMIENIKQELNTTEKLILRVRWFIGCQAFILMENRKYGDRSVEEFAADLGLSPSSIYEARRFYVTYTKEELDQRLIERQIPYRRALAMTRCKDAEQRQIIEDAAYAQALTDEQVDDLVRAANSGVKIPEEADKLKEIIDDITTSRDAERAHKEAGDVDDEDADDALDAETLSNATADINGERAVLRRIREACGDAERACTVVNAAIGKTKQELDSLDLLSEEGYQQAEKALMETAGAVKSTILVLYDMQKALNLHNIVIRG